MSIKVGCQFCGKRFVVPPSRKNPRFCSNDCRKKYGYMDIRTEVKRICPTCHKEFTTKEAWIRKGAGIFCSRKCVKPREGTKMYWMGINSRGDIDINELIRLYKDEGLGSPELAKRYHLNPASIRNYLLRSGITLRTNKEAQALRSVQGKSRGSNSSRWGGGKKMNRGYVEIFKPDHHRADVKGYVREHILVWEMAQRKPVPNGWVIHHYNGIKDDNRPENLFAFSNSEHSRKELGDEYKKRIRQLELEVAQLKAQLAKLN